jgi:hypothetical protein
LPRPEVPSQLPQGMGQGPRDASRQADAQLDLARRRCVPQFRARGRRAGDRAAAGALSQAAGWRGLVEVGVSRSRAAPARYTSAATPALHRSSWPGLFRPSTSWTRQRRGWPGRRPAMTRGGVMVKTGNRGQCGRRPRPHVCSNTGTPSFVMAGPDPAIHVFVASKAWMAGTTPGHDAWRGWWFENNQSAPRRLKLRCCRPDGSGGGLRAPSRPAGRAAIRGSLRPRDNPQCLAAPSTNPPHRIPH